MDDPLTDREDEEIESLRGLVESYQALVDLQELVASYRLLVPRLQAQTEDARREAAGMAPKPRPCTSESRSGATCELTAGHPTPHMRHGDNVVRSWGP